MSRKAREDSSSWKTPSIYFFNGDYGPYKAKEFNPIENVLVLLYHSLYDRDEEGRHNMLSLAGKAQHLLLRKQANHNNLEEESPSISNGIMIIDIRSMFDNKEEEGDNEKDISEDNQGSTIDLEDALSKEAEDTELTKGFGKYLLKLFQRMILQKVTLVAHGDLCGLTLKLHKFLCKIDPDIISQLCLLQPTLSTKFINTHLVVGSNAGNNDNNKKKKNGKNGSAANNGKKEKKKKKGKAIATATPQQAPGKVTPLNLVVNDDSGSRVELLRQFYPEGKTTKTTTIISDVEKEEDGAIIPSDIDISHLLLVAFDEEAAPTIEAEEEGKENIFSYDPEYFNELGKSMYMSDVKCEMSYHTKQYERKFEDITKILMSIELPPPLETWNDDNDTAAQNAFATNNNSDNSSIINASRYVGAMVLRGNRCILVRSLEGEWDGMRIPVVEREDNESPYDAAIRAVMEYADVEPEAVRTLPREVLPIPIYAPNVQNVIHIYPLYAADPPPDGPLEDADMEDDEDYYDWYTYPNASKRLAHEPSSLTAIQMMSLNLMSAAKAGLVPSKWGGVFGQELRIS